MPDMPKPVLIVTRPEADSARFVEAVRKACGIRFESIISPLLEIVQRPVAVPDTNIAHLVLTSVNGATSAGRLDITRKAIAWCVGSKTAATAQALGFRTQVFGGTGDELLNAMIAAKPVGQILYLRGKHARVPIASRLRQAGFSCNDLVAYDQNAAPLTEIAMAAFKGPVTPILPLFSPRTSEILKAQIPSEAQLHLIAMSDAVKYAFGNDGVQSVHVAKEPTEPAMIAETVAAIARQGNIMQP